MPLCHDDRLKSPTARGSLAAMYGGMRWALAILSGLVASSCIELPTRQAARGDGGGGAEPGATSSGATGGQAAGGSTSEGGGPGSTALPICKKDQTEDCARVSQFALGDEHGCVLASDGFVRCWGSNLKNQLGDPATAKLAHHPPQLVPSLQHVDEVAASRFTTCARIDERVRCWGANQFGQLGMGDSVERSATHELALDHVTTIRGGDQQHCAVREPPNGGPEVWCWGEDFEAFSSEDVATFSASPRRIQGLDDLESIDELSLGGTFACAAGNGGQVVRCWGSNQAGRLGDGTEVTSQTAVSVINLAGAVENMESGCCSTCVVVGPTKSFQCWGSINAPVETVLAPKTYPEINAAQVVDIQQGWQHHCQLYSFGQIRCMGRDFYGEFAAVGPKGASPVYPPIVVASNIELFNAGWQHSCAVQTDNTVICWGRNHHGQTAPGVSLTRIFDVVELEFPE